MPLQSMFSVKEDLLLNEMKQLIQRQKQGGKQPPHVRLDVHHLPTWKTMLRRVTEHGTLRAYGVDPVKGTLEGVMVVGPKGHHYTHKPS